jgi:hypothetical protein
MTRRRTDFRGLQARRDAALSRPELRQDRRKPSEETMRLVEAAVKAGRVTRCPPAGRRQR